MGLTKRNGLLLECGNPGGGGAGMNCMQRKNENINYHTQHVKIVLFKGWLWKGHPFCSYRYSNKSSNVRIFCVKKLPKFSF